MAKKGSVYRTLVSDNSINVRTIERNGNVIETYFQPDGEGGNKCDTFTWKICFAVYFFIRRCGMSTSITWPLHDWLHLVGLLEIRMHESKQRITEKFKDVHPV